MRHQPQLPLASRSTPVDLFRDRARATVARLNTSLIFSKDDAVAALLRYAQDHGVSADIAQAILREVGL